jgi:hypothetical protein
VNSVKEMPDSEARRDLTLGYRSTIKKESRLLVLTHGRNESRKIRGGMDDVRVSSDHR